MKFKVTDEIFLELEAPEDFYATQGSRTFVLALEQLCGALATLWFKEQQYGGAWREQGWMGNLARIMSKTARLRNMLWRDVDLNGGEEPITDTLQDLVNLCVFAILNRHGGNKWGKP